ncbi:MAG: NAD-dependent succinate-semialdehyde dehydrogenase [Rhizobiales bacterium]|nr:NAD-dependent succinate-semialdehyde dehydrogenase [Hyphomicrobiales bacterium]MBO6698841.1 NAD-dependent succinate-semialdehyde dehydrogenase [Hyphomicrobiales bacterium]MBO6734906.1 NAD-dependent succinate-semialdehyde dehydrogenase [Hyphomicrobiales bacterium]MBO6911288.1 NAD-dependent succinate-semialdehyde dehydrogenase [Hyphomicrobiales bacterium]MBO6955708.1 NAD-dependent succinate-semialdehyde dehydrogenase [Hyphomicrobiales bacterium]
MINPSFSSLVREQNLINGAWVDADNGQTINVTDPAMGQTIATVPNSGQTETQRAIDAAHDAFPAYAGLTLGERVALMRKLHDAIQDNLEGMAQMLTAEQGKPLSESRAEVGSSAAYVLWFAEEARRTNGAIIPSPIAGRKLMTTRHPVGVVAAITPWNFPSSMLARKLGPALAAGCTVVVKPASATPLSGLVWGHLAEQVGFPKGVVNVLTGSARAIGGEITSNPKVRKITFTGSTEIGKQLLAEASSTVKRMSMELGGNAPFIVFNDADLDKAVDGALIAKFRNAGQTCICTNRLFVQAGIYDRFVEAFAQRVSAMKVAPGAEDGSEQGPLVDGAALSKIEELVADALSKGGDLVTGGGRHDRGGLFYQPTVIGNATPSMRVTTEEIFGPIAPVYRFNDEEEAISAANDTDYGLASYAYTQDLARAFRLQDKLEYGLIGINEVLIVAPEIPFGGLKESGLGKEGSWQGIDDYLETKYTCIGGL